MAEYARDMGKAVVNYVVDNPGKTALYVVQAAAIVTPGAVFGPVLGAIGFSTAGPVAGR